MKQLIDYVLAMKGNFQLHYIDWHHLFTIRAEIKCPDGNWIHAYYQGPTLDEVCRQTVAALKRDYDKYSPQMTIAL